jgi:lipoprotein-anchoring transpeptidase ErfK/SrfK
VLTETVRSFFFWVKKVNVGQVVLIVAAAWMFASAYFQQISAGATMIPARSSDAKLASVLQTRASAYQLKVGYPDASVKGYSLRQLGLAYDASFSVQATRMQANQFVNRLAWWHPVPSEIVLEMDEAALDNFIAKNISVTVQPSKDANITIKNGKILLTDAVEGKQYGLENPKPTLLGMARNFSPGIIKIQMLRSDPPLSTALLEPYKDELTKIIGQPANFTIGGVTVHPGAAQIASWLDISPNDKTKKLDISVNSGKVSAYINAIAYGAIRPARDEVDIKTSAGTKVLVPGVSGVSVVNQSGISTSVAKNLLSAQGFAYSLPVGGQTFQKITAGDYPKWIEVDLTNKRLYAYEHAKLVNTILVSAGAPLTPTAIGSFKIYAKYVQQDMRGRNVDGSSYFQPGVPWVSYFYQDMAIHGNYWRPVSYFGNVNSSHGCVGMLDNDAEWIYSWAPIGTPVITHT